MREGRRPTTPPEPAGASSPSTPTATHGTIEIAGVRVTHPDRVLYPGRASPSGTLIDYYLAVADLILPHVAGRPLSLVRFPDGGGGDGFFQKHASAGFPDAFKPITIKEKEGKGRYLYIEDERGLVAAVQMGALELHIWGAHVDDAGEAGPPGVRLRPGRGGGLHHRQGVGEGDARPAQRAWPDVVRDGHRRQGHPRGGAADAAVTAGTT